MRSSIVIARLTFNLLNHLSMTSYKQAKKPVLVQKKLKQRNVK